MLEILQAEGLTDEDEKSDYYASYPVPHQARPGEQAIA
jgi:hypothetical protein